MHRASQSDRRAFGRRQTFVHALARIPGRAAEPCIVRNFSDGGALIEFAAEFVQPPQKLRLCVDARGIDTDCEVRRLEGRLVGVRFTDPAVAKRFESPARAAEPTAAVQVVAAAPVTPGRLQPIGSGVAMSIVSGADLRRRLFGETGRA